MPSLALIHTAHALIPEMEALCQRLLPDVRTAHFLDETVLRDAMSRKVLDADITQRVCEMAILAERGGADAVFVTCSSIGPAAEKAAGIIRIPLRRIDVPMCRQAVRRGGRVAVAATVETTLAPTEDLIRAIASERGKRLRVEKALFAKAFDARLAGDAEKHDAILQEGLEKLLRRCNTLVLAQASMARVASRLKPPTGVKILSSPESGIRQMREFLTAPAQ